MGSHPPASRASLRAIRAFQAARLALLFLALTALLGHAAGQAEIPVREATLGHWHYLHRLDDLVYAITQTDPMVIAFGADAGRVALLLPGSNLVAEFRDGHFFDFHFPAKFTPCSLAADHNGRLWCLGQELITSGYGSGDRWVFSFDGHRWSAPRRVPFSICDRLEFDQQNRLWALGPARTVAVLGRDGNWDTFTYSDDAKLGFTRVRLAADAAGDPVLFAYQMPWSESRLIGTLTYRAGNFVHDPAVDTKALIEAQAIKEPENGHYPNDPAVGQVISEFEGLRERTQLKWKGFTFVSLGTDGFAWTGPDDAATPPLSLDQEWERKWRPSGLTQETGSVVSPPPSGDVGLVPADFSSAQPAPNGLFYRDFHFFRHDKAGVTQIDFGLNPLAAYPFESHVVSAVLDPAGHIWTPGRDLAGPTWYVSHAVAVPPAAPPSAGTTPPR